MIFKCKPYERQSIYCDSCDRFVNNIPLIDERKTLNGHKNGGRRRVENIGNGSDDEEFYDDLLGQLVVDEKLNHQTEILEEAAVAES